MRLPWSTIVDSSVHSSEQFRALKYTKLFTRVERL